MKTKSISINEIKIVFPSLSVNESLARSVVSSFLMQTNPTLEEISDVKCAVSEAVTNAIIHGYKGKYGLIILKCTLFEERTVCIEIKDRGDGIEDINKAMQPLFTTNTDGDRSGMGFTVMQTFTDKVKVISRPGKGTTVKLTKKLSD